MKQSKCEWCSCDNATSYLVWIEKNPDAPDEENHGWRIYTVCEEHAPLYGIDLDNVQYPKFVKE